MKQKITNLLLFNLVLFLFSILAGCASNYYQTTTVNGEQTLYHVIDGQKNIVYKIDGAGKHTIYDQNDPKARELLAREQLNQQLAQGRQHRESKRADRYAQAIKRRANDPIYVTLFPTELGVRVAKSERPKGAVFQYIRKEFEQDRIIKLTEQKKADKYYQYKQQGKDYKNTFQNLKDDVRVYTSVRFEDEPAYNKTTKKFAMATFIHFTARIVSIYPKKEYTVESSAHFIQNQQAIKDLASKIKNVVKNEIGPMIPADRQGFR